MDMYDPERHNAKLLSASGIEVWAPAEGTDYLISNLGNAFNSKMQEHLQGSLNPETGYRSAGKHHVHTLIMDAFEGPPGDLVVDHLNDDRADNRYCNLERVTREENARRAMIRGRVRRLNGEVILPLPDNWPEILEEALNGVWSNVEAAKKLGRSPAWVAAKLLDMRFSEDAPLEDLERDKALTDAQAGLETFWRSWPRHPSYQVSNIGRVRRTENGGFVNVFSTESKHPKISGIGSVYTAVMSVYGPTRPTGRMVIRHFPLAEGDSIANLRWGTHQDNANDSIKQNLLPRGEDHPRAVHTIKEIEDSLQLFVEEEWTIKQLAEFLGDGRNVRKILDNQSWTIARRPEGLIEYLDTIGRDGEKHHAAVCTSEQLREAYRLYVEKRWTGVEFGRFLGVRNSASYLGLLTRGRSDVPFPPGFTYPWPGPMTANARPGEQHGSATLTEVKILSTFQKIISGELTSMKQVIEVLGVAKGQAYALCRIDKDGKYSAWPHLTRPAGLEEAVAEIQREILSEETQAAIMADLLSGADRNDVKQKYNLSETKIVWYVTQANKVLGKKHRKYTDEQRTEIRELIQQGLSKEEVTAKLGFDISPSNFSKYKKSVEKKERE